MPDDLTTLEQLLRERAAEVPYPQAAPRALLTRARRRVIRNALSSVVVVALIAGGASAGLASLGALGGADRVPGGEGGGGGSPQPTGAPSLSTPACTASALRATASLEGAAGSVVGSIDLTNFTSTPCTLQGGPTLSIFSAAGRPITVRTVGALPQWRADGRAAPAGWPVVRLRPGAAASIRLRWSNACPQLIQPAVWKVGVAGGTLDVFGTDGISPPPCNGAAEPSTLEVGPFEPSTT